MLGDEAAGQQRRAGDRLFGKMSGVSASNYWKVTDWLR
jgi:hypothetical protein